jgi:hypothetical protein
MPTCAPTEMDADWIETLFDELKTAFQRSAQQGTSQLAELAARVSELERSLSEAYELLVVAEQQAARLANLYVSAYQLHASLDPVEVRGAVAEIAVNLLGARSCVLLLSLDPERPGYDVHNLAADVPVGAPFDRQRYQGGDPAIDATLRDGASGSGRTPAPARSPSCRSWCRARSSGRSSSWRSCRTRSRCTSTTTSCSTSWARTRRRRWSARTPTTRPSASSARWRGSSRY